MRIRRVERTGELDQLRRRHEVPLRVEGERHAPAEQGPQARLEVRNAAHFGRPEVLVHVGEARDDEPPARVDHRRCVGNDEPVEGRDRGDARAGDDDRVLGLRRRAGAVDDGGADDDGGRTGDLDHADGAAGERKREEQGEGGAGHGAHSSARACMTTAPEGAEQGDYSTVPSARRTASATQRSPVVPVHMDLATACGHRSRDRERGAGEGDGLTEPAVAGSAHRLLRPLPTFAPPHQRVSLQGPHRLGPRRRTDGDARARGVAADAEVDAALGSQAVGVLQLGPGKEPGFAAGGDDRDPVADRQPRGPDPHALVIDERAARARPDLQHERGVRFPLAPDAEERAAASQRYVPGEPRARNVDAAHLGPALAHPSINEGSAPSALLRRADHERVAVHRYSPAPEAAGADVVRRRELGGRLEDAVGGPGPEAHPLLVGRDGERVAVQREAPAEAAALDRPGDRLDAPPAVRAGHVDVDRTGVRGPAHGGLRSADDEPRPVERQGAPEVEGAHRRFGRIATAALREDDHEDARHHTAGPVDHGRAHGGE